MTELTISKAAKNAGVGVETIRFYERKGLIEQPPKPLDNGFRVYPEETVQRVRFISQAQEIGFSLREIEELRKPSSRKALIRSSFNGLRPDQAFPRHRV